MASAERPGLDAATEAAIVKTCIEHHKAHWGDTDYRTCVNIGTEYFVKFGSRRALWPEIATQQYVSEHAESHADTPGTPRVPKIVHHFQDQTFTYLVMEYVKLTDPPPDLSERIAEALKWLASVPAPPDHVIGPLGGGRIRHGFFKDNEAPLLFTSTEALERYIARASRQLSKTARDRTQPVKISHERLMFAQSDMDPGNFGVDAHGRTVLLNFARIGVLPESFAACTASSNEDLAEALGWSCSANGASMARISACLWMTGDTRLGLNEDSYPKKQDSRR